MVNMAYETCQLLQSAKAPLVPLEVKEFITPFSLKQPDMPNMFDNLHGNTNNCNEWGSSYEE